MITRCDSSLLFFVSVLLACSGSSRPSAPPPDPVPEPQVSAALQGAGRCVAGTCTMHFARIAHGDTTSIATARCTEPSCPTKRGQLTSAGQRRVREIAEALAPAKLAEAYGCAGCADGPIYEVIVHRPNGMRSEVTIDPLNLESVPEPLRAASAWIDTVSEALERCTSNEWVEVAADCAQNEDRTPLGRP